MHKIWSVKNHQNNNLSRWTKIIIIKLYEINSSTNIVKVIIDL